MTAVDNTNTSSIELESNLVFPKNRKEISELVSKFKNLSKTPKTREEIKEYISLIKKQYRDDKRKIRLENKNQSGTKRIGTIPTQTLTNTTTTTTTKISKSNDTDSYKKSRKEMRDLIKQFKKSSDVPKSRKEISEFIDSIKTEHGSNKLHHVNLLIEKTSVSDEIQTKEPSNDIIKNTQVETQTISPKLEKLKLKKAMLQRKLSIVEIKIEQLGKSKSITTNL